MRLRQRTVIDRPAAQVWPHVIRPESFQRWNDKIRSMDASREFRVGQPFTTHYLWQGKALQCASIPTEIQAERVLELRHTAVVGRGVSPNLEIRQRITLHPQGARTAVTKLVSIENHGMPWYLLALVSFVTRFGAPVGPDPLKVLCEAEAPEPRR